MSDELSPNGLPAQLPATDAPAPALPNGRAPRQPRGRRKATVEASEQAGAPATRGRRKAAPAEPAPTSAPPAEEPSEIAVGGAAPAPLPFWGEQQDGAAPTRGPGATTADSLYEVELEVRNQAEQRSGQAPELGFLAAGALQLVGENLRRMGEQQAARVSELLRGVDLTDYLDPDFWRGIGMVLRYQIDEQVAFVRRRMAGEYTTDAYGMDREVIEVVRPFLRFMYRTWWRVQAEGLEHVPAASRALLVANHSGVLPWDGAMIAVAVAEDHPAGTERIVRSLHLHWFSSLPFIAPALAAMGQVPGLPENAVRLLEHDELVAVFPEGLKGVGKLFKDRYKLARFGRGGFVQAALRARAPIVPVTVVGAEEIYPMLANAEPVAKLLGFPYFPLTPFFPWLGPLGVIPLPTRWSITFCPPLPTDTYGPEAADDPLTVLGLAEQVRETIQATIDARLAERTSVF
ncbi:MAG: lysophospholipid acyltransferase family protein [Chloroflexi bacterium OHK40]